ncbi:GDNF family receptor alpha-like [Anneissia japonica]|uniref:GDNF family receptor alpha-like n=1 Tax=Anneissia japonica TaxID=1529436 RepID=UPI00142566E5|nr:GDNF family receptor alpha-like [Anneissia japonica]
MYFQIIAVDYSDSVENPENSPDSVVIEADIAPTPMTKSVNEPYSFSSGLSYDSDISSGSSYKSSDYSLSDCWTEVNRCRRRDSGGACSKSFSTFEIACSCDEDEPFACASDAPKCQEARNLLEAFSLVNCDCPEDMRHRKRCLFVYDKLFNNPCVDGCKDYFVEPDSALNGRILPYQDAISKCTEAEEGGCIDYLVELSAACYSNCSQTKCQQATGDFVKHVDPLISQSILFTDCNGSNSGPDCVDTISKVHQKCAITVTPTPNCLELPIRCQGILGCRKKFQNFENQCDPNRCSQDVYKSCRASYTALLSTPIAINCTCNPDDVHFSQCRVFQRRVLENSCVDRSILSFQDPSFEKKKEHSKCTVKLDGDTSLLHIKMDTVIRVRCHMTSFNIRIIFYLLYRRKLIVDIYEFLNYKGGDYAILWELLYKYCT